MKILEECQDRSFLEGEGEKKPSTHITWVKLKADQQHQQEWNMLKEEEEFVQNPVNNKTETWTMMKKLSNLERAHPLAIYNKVIT